MLLMFRVFKFKTFWFWAIVSSCILKPKRDKDCAMYEYKENTFILINGPSFEKKNLKAPSPRLRCAFISTNKDHLILKVWSIRCIKITR